MGILSSLQTAIADRLRESDVIASAPAIEVVEEDKGDLDAAIARAVGKMGIVIIVETTRLGPEETGSPFFSATVLISVQENVPINRGPAGSRKTWSTVGEHIIATLIDWAPPGGWSPLEFASPLERLGPGNPVEAQLTLTTQAVLKAA